MFYTVVFISSACGVIEHVHLDLYHFPICRYVTFLILYKDVSFRRSNKLILFESECLLTMRNFLYVCICYIRQIFKFSDFSIAGNLTTKIYEQFIERCVEIGAILTSFWYKV